MASFLYLLSISGLFCDVNQNQSRNLTAVKMGTEKFCLKWNDFESNISGAFKDIRDAKDFFDVTLACDDDQLQAHKVILSACSPFFRNILRKNSHNHPLLYLKGVKYKDLVSVLKSARQLVPAELEAAAHSIIEVGKHLGGRAR